jgi:lipoprotein-anchoring transpeptidase ErfK/SrfK
MKKHLLTVLIIFMLIASQLNTASAYTDGSKACAVSVQIDQKEKDRIKALIKTGYKGDYTLQWAKEHDYKESDKVKWVNIKGYTSNTKYLVWVSIAYQRLNVFTGSKGNWNLTNTFIIGTGVRGRETPTGVFKLIDRNPGGWTTSIYTVKPVVTFINEKYGFHSRLYYPGSTKIYDAKIGFPCSHGCIRMYTNDVAWFYEHIPLGTTVVVY